ncbi:ABC transporter substrate-binding protein [Pseudonocardia sp. N23]|uniref:ABC transporter substrate-binding protein n=1 Tax=Pseudonocardia sp. N23 TaxID=1987376 RepID=UPI000C038AC7|nr:ABC transporter substrate-binding protein [Pseudonocardia sp. N23]GAY08787.1 periplasmic binding protein [Pseudonocardia sp. N23]
MSTKLSRPARRVRRTIAGAAIAVATLAVAACGGGSTGGAPATTSAPAAAAGDSFPVTITHKFGTTTVPAAPTRIIALGKIDAEAAISLGVTPIATSSGLDTYPWLDAELKRANSVTLADDAGTPIEQVASLKPDLIIAMDTTDQAGYDALAAIAPTLTSEKERFSYSWQDFTRYVGKAMGKSAEADKVVTDTEAEIAAIKAANPAIAGKTFSLSYLSKDYPLVRYKDTDQAVQFFTSLGMKRTASLDPIASGQITLQDDYLSLEQLNMLDANVVVTGFGTPEDKAFFDSNRVFTSMNAFQKKAVVELDTAQIGQVFLPSALGNVAVLEQIAPLLSKAAQAGA